MTSSDIFSNLKSFRLDIGLSDEERNLLPLRKKHYMTELFLLSHSSYFVAVLNETKKIIAMKAERTKTTKQQNAKKSSKAQKPTEGCKLGIIGGGRIGQLLVKVFIRYNNIPPQDITISTRRPDALTHFQNDGISCIYNNNKVAKESDILFLCCLPSQFQDVAKDIKGDTHGVIISLIGGMPLKKLSYMLDCRDIVQMEFKLPSTTSESDFGISEDVVSSLEKPEIYKRTCPFGVNEEGSVYSKIVDLMVYMCVNFIMKHGWTKEDCLRLTNRVVFGNDTFIEFSSFWPSEHASLDNETESERWKFFDLIDVQNDLINLDTFIKGKESQARTLFTSRYFSFFDKFKTWQIDFED